MTLKKNLAHTLELNGMFKNLLDADIAVMMGTGYSTFEAGGQLKWSGAEKPTKLTNIGKVNSVFTLVEPAVKINDEEVAREYANLSAEEASMISRILREGARQKKGRVPCYCIVSRTAAIVARTSLQRDLEYMLVPTFETQLNEQRVHIGFIPARLLFEKLEV